VNHTTRSVHLVKGGPDHHRTFVPEAILTFIKKQNVMNSSGKVFLGLLAGLAAGATLGILFAPDKGTVTRKKIADKGNDYADDIAQRFNDFTSEVNKKMEALGHKATNMAENVNHKASNVMEDLKSSVKSDR
jgi:gas vesicle protein